MTVLDSTTIIIFDDDLSLWGGDVDGGEWQWIQGKYGWERLLECLKDVIIDNLDIDQVKQYSNLKTQC